jgi:DNA replication protein DnaC
MWIGSPTRTSAEVLEDRYKLASTIITSQLNPGNWHAAIADATIADAICDRIVHNAHRIKLGGESIRKKESLTSGKKPAK